MCLENTNSQAEAIEIKNTYTYKHPVFRFSPSSSHITSQGVNELEEIPKEDN